jgi:DNA processing protein
VNDFTEPLFWYRLFLAKGIGPKTMHHIQGVLSEEGISAERLCSMEFEEFQTVLPGVNRRIFEALHEPETDMDRELQMLLDNGIEPIHLGHESYPPSVLERLRGNAPPLLFCRGNPGLLEAEGVAVVGSRNASARALDLARALAKELAQSGKNVISGYAKGIDTQAHLGALQQDGTTTMVLSMGIRDFSKKKEFEGLRWTNNVLLVSQFHPSERWRARNAMIRNKLLCALAKAVVVVESGTEKDKDGKTSGTFNTGRTALEMGVPLFAVDPAILGKPNLGNQELIHLGAIKLTIEKGMDEAVNQVVKHIKNADATPVPPPDDVGQMPLFP